ncbi:MAG: hypothetical protein O6952_00630, partial [Planctomycetota bacterium]|nr:hypothetical protein [Planctomycetota bacterium]
MQRNSLILAFLTLAMATSTVDARPLEEELNVSMKVVPLETLPWLPVAVTVAVVNKSSEERIHFPFVLGSGLDVAIESTAEGWKSNCQPFVHMLRMFNKPPRLQPKEKYVQKAWIFWDDPQRSHSIPRSGLYIVDVGVQVEWPR